MEIQKKKHRRPSLRHPAWDYAGSGWYFVTICVRDKACLFGEINDEGGVQLGTIGRIVAEEWQKTPTIRPYVSLDEWVIMPSHLHGILIIDDSCVGAPRRGAPTTERDVSHWRSGCLGAIIGRFKETCTKRIRAMGYDDFAWQRNFYDHVIRNEKDLERIRVYIHENPERWAFDEENPACSGAQYVR